MIETQSRRTTVLLVLLGLTIFCCITWAILPPAVTFALRLRMGTEKMRQSAFDELYHAMVERKPMPFPSWTFSCLTKDRDPVKRIYGGKFRYLAAPKEPLGIDVILGETKNTSAFVRGCALAELWNVHEYVDRTLPALEHALFEDAEEGVRRSAFSCLLPLSEQHKEARAMIERAATEHPIQLTREFAKSRLIAWDRRQSNQVPDTARKLADPQR